MTPVKKKPSQEKRLHPRFSIEIPVEFRVLDDQKEIDSFLEWMEKEKKGKTQDVSLGGMQIVASHPLKKGAILQIDLIIPPHKEKLVTYAEVIWPGEYGGGLKFLMMADDVKKNLKSFLEKQLSP